MVTATVDDRKLADDVLQVPGSIQTEIREKTSTSADFREMVIDHYLQYFPLLWLVQVITYTSEATTNPSEATTDVGTVAFTCDRNTLLTERDLSDLLTQLNNHATKWRDIGTHHPGELDNIQARPFLMPTAPESWLGAMLTEWLQRAPNDTRGSSSIESLTHALSKCGIGTKFEQ
jgi:hypothetical protein